jgi:hypothetical protein
VGLHHQIKSNEKLKYECATGLLNAHNFSSIQLSKTISIQQTIHYFFLCCVFGVRQAGVEVQRTRDAREPQSQAIVSGPSP